MVIKTLEQAKEVALELERIEATRKKLRGALRKYVEECGEVDTGERVWEIAQTTSWKMNSNTLKKVAEAIVLDGRDPWEFMNISTPNLRKLGWSDNDLSNLGLEKRVYNRFTSRSSQAS